MNSKNLLEQSKIIIHEEFENKKDKGGNPYLEHLYFVGENVEGGIENKIVGHLHDLIEDTDYTILDLVNLGFPNKIISDILGVTKMKGEEYAAFILRSSLSDVSKEVKMTDLTSNSDLSRIKEPKNKDLKRRSKYIYFYDCLKYDIFTDQEFNCSFPIFDSVGEHYLLSYNPNNQNFTLDKPLSVENLKGNKRIFSKKEITTLVNKECLLFFNKNTLDIELFK